MDTYRESVLGSAKLTNVLYGVIRLLLQG